MHKPKVNLKSAIKYHLFGHCQHCAGYLFKTQALIVRLNPKTRPFRTKTFLLSRYILHLSKLVCILFEMKTLSFTTIILCKGSLVMLFMGRC